MSAPPSTALYAVGVPIVRQGWLEPLEPVDQISGTDHEAGSAVASYLLGHGHLEIAYVHGDPRYRGRMERLFGLREVLERTEGAILHDLIWEDDAGFEKVFDRLRASGGEPTAYFCAHDGLAVTVISELLARGLRIPEDASVIGFGDFSAALQILPRLTTVKTHGISHRRHGSQAPGRAPHISRLSEVSPSRTYPEPDRRAAVRWTGATARPTTHLDPRARQIDTRVAQARD